MTSMPVTPTRDTRLFFQDVSRGIKRISQNTYNLSFEIGGVTQKYQVWFESGKPTWVNNESAEPRHISAVRNYLKSISYH